MQPFLRLFTLGLLPLGALLLGASGVRAQDPSLSDASTYLSAGHSPAPPSNGRSGLGLGCNNVFLETQATATIATTLSAQSPYTALSTTRWRHLELGCNELCLGSIGIKPSSSATLCTCRQPPLRATIRLQVGMGPG